jgi:hypothetical protein
VESIVRLSGFPSSSGESGCGDHGQGGLSFLPPCSARVYTAMDYISQDFLDYPRYMPDANTLSRCIAQDPRAGEDRVEHRAGDAAGEGVLLAGVVPAEERHGCRSGRSQPGPRAVRAGARPTIRIDGAGSPQPGTGRPQYRSSLKDLRGRPRLAHARPPCAGTHGRPTAGRSAPRASGRAAGR